MSINWDKIAELYANQRPSSYGAMIEEPVVSRMLSDVRGKRILDAGCAGGYLSAKLYDAGADVTAIDISRKMLKHAKKASKNRDIDFVRADINHFPFHNRFDAVLASLLFNNVWNYEDSLKSIYKVLKRNGDFIFSVEHPILTSGDYEGKHPRVDDYFTQRYVTRNWTFSPSNKEVEWKTIHRSVSAYLNPLAKKFKIMEVAEPKPPEELKKLNRKVYKKRMIAPVFLVVKSKKI
jgi:SAM-dependent methyltransferase